MNMLNISFAAILSMSVFKVFDAFLFRQWATLYLLLVHDYKLSIVSLS